MCAIIRSELSAAGLTIYGGEHAPYVWIKTPDGMDSWGFFDHLLNKANVVGTPGSGFGAHAFLSSTSQGSSAAPFCRFGGCSAMAAPPNSEV